MAAAKDKNKRPDPAKMSFEQATEELEAIIERIEAGEIGLEASLGERRRGEALIKRSREILDAAEEELKQVQVGEGDEADD
ncbi:MAG: exodeoxyribonuclease VII small subunit [Planctomycetota bacterium]|jgi:exodeoxyribonuclease VII small subunit